MIAQNGNSRTMVRIRRCASDRNCSNPVAAPKRWLTRGSRTATQERTGRASSD